MQFRDRDKDAIGRGELTLTFRRWRRPQARTGGQYRVGAYVIEVTAVDEIEPEQITIEDARAVGQDSAQGVLDAVRREQRSSGDPNAPLYRVAFRSLGEQPDPRRVLGADADLDSEELAEIVGRLAKMDARARQGPWTGAALAAIAAAPGRRAAELAEAQGRETAKYKADIRKLKALGLTNSLEVGYELSARGQAVLRAIEGPPSP